MTACVRVDRQTVKPLNEGTTSWHEIPDCSRETLETSIEEALIQGYYGFHIAGNELLAMLVIKLKDCRWFIQFKVCHGSLYAVMWLADEPREFNLPIFPQRRISYVPEKLPSKYGVHSEELFTLSLSEKAQTKNRQVYSSTVQQFLYPELRQILIQTLVMPYFDYCDVLYSDLNVELSLRLQRANSAADAARLEVFDHGIKARPSGRLPSARLIPVGSKRDGMPQEVRDLLMISLSDVCLGMRPLQLVEDLAEDSSFAGFKFRLGRWRGLCEENGGMYA
ncbi:hypothetical protein ANN_21986 [Periplaneta americana]|uniref:Uncharacterized protein n=1 Tax=Periplaneta americana TaxID=6978 RepID=A0ABQ8S790_PERAM|nr:hypothetical protein ANN_21986 [Periplaneta americana]